MVARGMVRGEGRTDGYYEKIIPFFDIGRFRFSADLAEPRQLEDIARERIAPHSNDLDRHFALTVATFDEVGKAKDAAYPNATPFKAVLNRAKPWVDNLMN